MMSHMVLGLDEKNFWLGLVESIEQVRRTADIGKCLEFNTLARFTLSYFLRQMKTF